MILHIEPVPDIFTLAVNRDRFHLKDVIDGQWDQFFRKLVGAVIV